MRPQRLVDDVPQNRDAISSTTGGRGTALAPNAATAPRPALPQATAGAALRHSGEERRIDHSTTNRRAFAADLLQIASSLTIDAISDCCSPFVRAVGGHQARIGRGLDPARKQPCGGLDIGRQRRVVPAMVGGVIADDVDHRRWAGGFGPIAAKPGYRCYSMTVRLPPAQEEEILPILNCWAKLIPQVRG